MVHDVLVVPSSIQVVGDCGRNLAIGSLPPFQDPTVHCFLPRVQLASSRFRVDVELGGDPLHNALPSCSFIDKPFKPTGDLVVHLVVAAALDRKTGMILLIEANIILRFLTMETHVCSQRLEDILHIAAVFKRHFNIIERSSLFLKLFHCNAHNSFLLHLFLKAGHVHQFGDVDVQKLGAYRKKLQADIFHLVPILLRDFFKIFNLPHCPEDLVRQKYLAVKHFPLLVQEVSKAYHPDRERWVFKGIAAVVDIRHINVAPPILPRHVEDNNRKALKVIGVVPISPSDVLEFVLVQVGHVCAHLGDRILLVVSLDFHHHLHPFAIHLNPVQGIKPVSFADKEPVVHAHIVEFRVCLDDLHRVHIDTLKREVQLHEAAQHGKVVLVQPRLAAAINDRWRLLRLLLFLVLSILFVFSFCHSSLSSCMKQASMFRRRQAERVQENAMRLRPSSAARLAKAC